MKASLIFCSTSHSINVQKVSLTAHSIDPDLQNRLVESVRFEMHNSRNHGCRRANFRVHERMTNGIMSKRVALFNNSIRAQGCYLAVVRFA